MITLSQRRELRRRQLYHTWQAIEALEDGELWHPLSEYHYHKVLVETFDELEEDLDEIEGVPE